MHISHYSFPPMYLSESCLVAIVQLITFNGTGAFGINPNNGNQALKPGVNFGTIEPSADPIAILGLL